MEFERVDVFRFEVGVAISAGIAGVIEIMKRWGLEGSAIEQLAVEAVARRKDDRGAGGKDKSILLVVVESDAGG